jgi:hypothetical protein
LLQRFRWSPVVLKRTRSRVRRPYGPDRQRVPLGPGCCSRWSTHCPKSAQETRPRTANCFTFAESCSIILLRLYLPWSDHEVRNFLRPRHRRYEHVSAGRCRLHLLRRTAAVLSLLDGAGTNKVTYPVVNRTGWREFRRNRKVSACHRSIAVPDE